MLMRINLLIISMVTLLLFSNMTPAKQSRGGAAMKWVIQRSPGDGSCLFHSVSTGSDVPAKQLRKQTVRYLNDHRGDDISGMTLKQLIETDPGVTFSNYVNNMKSSTEWGGGPEIFAMSRILKRSILVYSKDDSGMKLISSLGEYKGSKLKPIRLLYSGSSHYDCLVII